MASGALPSDLPSIAHRGAGAEADIRFAARHLSPKLCSVCGDPDPQAALFYTGGLVVRVHAACEAIWQQERVR